VILLRALEGKLDDIDVAAFQKATGFDPYNVLPLPRPKPGEPAGFLPLVALGKLVALHEKFKSAGPVRLGPTYLAYSESDMVIDGGYAKSYLSASAPGLDLTAYPAAESIGHSIETRALNPHFDEMIRAIEKLCAL